MPTVQDRWINKVLGGTRYVLSEKLGEGGMGAVYLAEDRKLGTLVVIKTPHATMLRDPEFSARFKQEVQALVTLSHPRIVRVMDVGQYGEFPFVVLQYLSGGSLDSLLYPRAAEAMDVTRLQSLTQVCSWLTEVASALDFIHLQGCIHRDVKPANILFDEDQHAYLTDFGIAKVLANSDGSLATKLTATGMILGTAEYMSPELLQGKSIDHRVDQYALAVTVFEALTGTRPYEGNTPAALAFAQVQQPIPQVHQRTSDLPMEVSRVLSRALALSPDERFRSCTEFANAVCAACPTVVSPGRSGRAELSTSVTSRSRAASETLTTSLASKNLPDTDRVDESSTLRQEIDEAVKRKKYDGLLPLVKSYLKLKPGSLPMQRLVRDLIKNRPARAVAHYKGTGRYFDIAGRLIEPKELLLLSALGFLALFFMVYLGAVLYFQTPSGIVEIRVESPGVEVKFADEMITVISSGKEYKLKPTDRKTLQIETDGVLIDGTTTEVTVANKEHKIISAKLIPDGKIELSINNLPRTFNVKNKKRTTTPPLSAGVASPALPLSNVRPTVTSSPLPDAKLAPKGDDMAAIYKSLKITNVRIVGGPFSVGDSVRVTYELQNTSDAELQIPQDNSFSQPFNLVGTRQHWIERQGNDSTIPGITPQIGRQGSKYAAGGSIIPAKTRIAAGERLPFEEYISTKGYPAGKYTYYIEYKKVRDGDLQTEKIEFELRNK